MKNKELTILSIYEINADARKRLEAIYPFIRIYHTPTLESMEPYIEEAEIILHGFFSDDLLKRARKLQWYQSVNAGIDDLLTPDFVESDVFLTSAKGNHPISVSEHAFALLLVLTRNIYRCFGRNNILERWDRSNCEELYGKTAGILGVGQIGREIALKAHAFGMHVRGYGRAPVFVSYINEFYESSRIKEFFTGLDVVFIAVSITQDSKGMVNRQLLSLMNQGSYLINICRGVAVVEEDIIDALKNGPLKGAGLDVFIQEPLPRNHELLRLPNVVLSPHLGGLNPRYEERVLDLMVENFRRWVQIRQGKKIGLINVVDKKSGT